MHCKEYTSRFAHAQEVVSLTCLVVSLTFLVVSLTSKSGFAIKGPQKMPPRLKYLVSSLLIYLIHVTYLLCDNVQYISKSTETILTLIPFRYSEG